MYQQSYLPQQGYVPQQDSRTNQRANEFNEEEEGPLYQLSPMNTCSSWLLHLCPFIFLMLTLIVSYVLFQQVNSLQTSQDKQSKSLIGLSFPDNQPQSGPSFAACPTQIKRYLLDFNYNIENKVRTYSLIIIILSIIGLVLTLLYLCANNLKCRYGGNNPCNSPNIYYIILLLCFVVCGFNFVLAAKQWKGDAISFPDDIPINYLKLYCASQISSVELAKNKIQEIYNKSDWNPIPSNFLFAWSVIWIVLWIGTCITRKFIIQDVVVRRP